jgi:dTDP-4-amino-4,6-dideoxygalactose transaminase
MAGPGMSLFGRDEIDEVNDTLRSRELCRYRFINPDDASPSKVDRLEAEILALTGARHAIAMNSCSSALITGLWAAGIGGGDEVIVPGYTFVAPISAVLFAGAKTYPRRS